jgi:hypothetical protein
MRRETVTSLTLWRRAICAAVFRPDRTLSMMSACWTELSLRRRQAGPGSLTDHGPLELGEGADHLHHHAPGRDRGVDSFRQRPEAGMFAFDPLHDGEQILQRAGQPVEFPDHDHIFRSELVEQAVQFRTVPPAPGRGLLEELFHAGLRQGTALGGGALIIASGDA